MPNITLKISGTFTLAEIESAIRFEEKKSKEFISSTVSDNDNLAVFKRLEFGAFPKALKLTLAMDPAPGGFTPFPNLPIAMMVEGLKTDVKAWRKQ
ncbi:MAG: hypothetical protein PHG89_07925 [Gallionella sp.]|nr:hypothetical protein [Gallionella sp.]